MILLCATFMGELLLKWFGRSVRKWPVVDGRVFKPGVFSQISHFGCWGGPRSCHFSASGLLCSTIAIYEPADRPEDREQELKEPV